MTNTERKLRAAGYGAKIDSGIITIKKQEVEIVVTYPEGTINYAATDRLATKIAKLLGWGGFKCGWGGWVLQKNGNGLDTVLRDQLGAGAY